MCTTASLIYAVAPPSITGFLRACRNDALLRMRQPAYLFDDADTGFCNLIKPVNVSAGVPKIRPGAPYDPNDRKSLQEYASRLSGKTLGEVCDAEFFRFSSKNKGSFGSILESGYFMIDSNNERQPDFEELGIELKTAPVVKTIKKEYRSKERMSLSNINYMTLLDEGIEGSLLHKNRELLIIFYIDDGETDVSEQVIIGSVIWLFPEDDMRIIKDDWKIIADMVERGLAHELSGGLTFYLEAAPKGPGKGKGMKKQPFSDVLAQTRAFALKPRYVGSILKAMGDAEKIVKEISEWDESKSFEDLVIGRFAPYLGMYFEELESIFGSFGDNDKGRYASMARLIMGVKGRKIEEFEKADVLMKTIRLKPNGLPKEDMSFPYFKNDDILNGVWEESEFHMMLDKKFLFVAYQIDPDGRVYLKAAGFWSMPAADMKEAEKVWLEAQRCIKEGDLDAMPKKSWNEVAHVRPHARDKKDTYVDSNGSICEKKSFWLNSSYIGAVLANFVNKAN